MGRKRERPRARKGTGSRGETASGREDDAGQEAEAARQALSWVVGRLNVLEFLILFLALILALLGGALVAWLLSPFLPLSFRWFWAVASLLLFILPGGFVYLREFREKGSSPQGSPKQEMKLTPREPKEPNG